MKDRLIEIETKHAYLENTVDELNSVVVKQQNQIDDLTKQVQRFLSEMSSLVSQIKDNSDEAPPPHF